MMVSPITRATDKDLWHNNRRNTAARTEEYARLRAEWIAQLAQERTNHKLAMLARFERDRAIIWGEVPGSAAR